MNLKTLLMATMVTGMVAMPGMSMPTYTSWELASNSITTENTPEEIIAKYIEAIGGKENVAKIKNLVMEMEAEFQGAEIKIKGISDQENKRLLQETSIMGNVAQRTVLVNGKGKMTAMGQEQEVSEDMIQILQAQTYVFPESHYVSMGYDLTYHGEESINGENSHAIVITTPNGQETMEYYSVASGLKLRTSSEQTGDITYGDYTEVQGVKIPMALTIQNPMLPTALKTKVTSVKFNQDLSEEDFN